MSGGAVNKLKKRTIGSADGGSGGGASGTTGQTPPLPPPEGTRQNSIQRIQERKRKVMNMPTVQKLAKLSMYSACQAPNCNCTGWKPASANRKMDVGPNNCPKFNEECLNSNCKHALECHVTHLDGMANEEMDNLLSAIVDIENLCISLQCIEDEDTKRVYQYIFRILRQSVVTRQPVVARGPMGDPPFESPCIADAIWAFVLHKFSHAGQNELTVMTEVAKIFLNFINHCQFEAPSMRRAHMTLEDAAIYKVNYTRWIVFCHVPAFCGALRQYATTQVFGRTFIRSVFQQMSRELIIKCNKERDRFNNEQRIIITKMPAFLESFKCELLKDDSPIWDPAYRPPNSSAMQQRKRQSSQQTISSFGTVTVTRMAPDTTSRRVGYGEYVKRSKRDTSDGNDNNGDLSDEVVLNAIKAIALSKANNKTEILFPLTKSCDEHVKREEEQRAIEFHIIGNLIIKPIDMDTLQRLLYLIDIFSHHLVKMPREYIAQLVLDSKHKTLALIKENHPIGGICFRPFKEKRFIEVVFCAVKKAEQAKGYGAHLMNHLKDYCIDMGIHHLLTYADCDAIGYFKKQGFSDHIKLSSNIYSGHIKEYDGATFMHCELHPGIVHTQFATVLKKQHEIIEHLYEERLKVQKIHSGLTCFKDGIKMPIPEDAIPGLIEAGWTSAMNDKFEPEPKNLKTLLGIVLQAVRQHESAWPFLRPVTVAEAPDYHDHIRYPMDLKTMADRLKKDYYISRRLFMADMMRIFSNCCSYNSADTEYCQCANTLARYFITKMHEMNLWDK